MAGDAHTAIKVAEGVRKWQKCAVSKRCSQQKLAKKLGTTVSKLRPFLKAPSKMIRKAGERSVILENASSARNAAQLFREVQPTTLSERSVRRLRQSIRNTVRAKKANKKSSKPLSRAICEKK